MCILPCRKTLGSPCRQRSFIHGRWLLWLLPRWKITGPTSRLRGFSRLLGDRGSNCFGATCVTRRSEIFKCRSTKILTSFSDLCTAVGTWKANQEKPGHLGGSFLSLKFRSQILSNESNLHVFHECHVHLLQCLCYRTAESWLGKIRAKKKQIFSKVSFCHSVPMNFSVHISHSPVEAAFLSCEAALASRQSEFPSASRDKIHKTAVILADISLFCRKKCSHVFSWAICH